ncbi:M-phase inducer phosphatase 2 isoform X2 [Ornithorhynchus anatinus]|uniref:M-phase inducer phosphatase 2 isoform X2 n=1 Tax=Ornithorhynchus anatinus TaxID=9258 RepID=UPI0004548806|nr:M-phase inducer phosphatase 2 isoform X2 [Ornithorhynchus anatinus]
MERRLDAMWDELSPARGVARPPRLSGLSLLPTARGLFCSPDPGPVTNSPVTNLTRNMDGLTGLGSNSETPKSRKRDLTFRNRRTFLSQESVTSESSDGGVCLDSPSQLDPQAQEEAFEKAIQESGRVIRDNKFPIRRIQSLPMRLLGSSPALKNITNARNLPPSPVDGPEHKQASLWDNKENFCSPERSEAEDEAASPMCLRRCSLTSILVDEGDDGFMDILEQDLKNDDDDVPFGMESLLTAPLVGKKEDLVMHSKCRRLFRSPSMPSSAIRPILKRLDRPQDRDTPIKTKRRKSITSPACEKAEEEPRARILRSKSLCHDEIENFLDNDRRELIGDYSKAYLLQTVDGRHQDLKYISSETMVAVLTDKFSNIIEKCIIVDCRYPYEFEGGHIKGAVNLPLEQDVENFLLREPIVPQKKEKRVILIFHCEFSSERGPRMCRFVREKDRATNDYPNLHYPEMYVLKGGYKEFFPQFQAFCEPQGYRPMNHEDFKEDLKRFRLKSRTWAGERSKREMYSRLKDF